MQPPGGTVLKTVATLVLLTLVLSLFGCSSETENDASTTDDPFASSTGAPIYKNQSATPEASAVQNAPSTVPPVMYLTNLAGNKFIALTFIDNLVDPIEAPDKFLGDDIVWNNSGTVKDGPGNWENRSTGNMFYVIYASKLKIQLQLDRKISSWNELPTAKIHKVIAHHFGKRKNIGMDTSWYFTTEHPAGY